MSEAVEKMKEIIKNEVGISKGRPQSSHVRVDEIAARFMAFKNKKKQPVRHYGENWYEYNGQCYQIIPPSDMEKELGKYLQDSYAEDMRISKSFYTDVAFNLKAHCGLFSRGRIPFWIKDYSDGTEWLPMENGLFNVNKAVNAILNGTTPDAPDIFKKNTPDLFSTYALNFSFDHKAQCPKWMKYLSEVQPDLSNRESLQMMFGLALVPETRYQVAFILYGEGGTGKSVCIHVLTHLVGLQNICAVPLSKFANKFGLAPLTTKLLNIVGDLPLSPEDGSIVAVEGIFKDVVEGGVIAIEEKMKNPCEAPAIARCVFATNGLPYFSDKSNGVWDRLRVIGFNQRFRDTPADNKNLKFEIAAEELPGIFNWALAGLAKLKKLRRFPDTTEGEALRREHRNACDHERVFLAEHCAEEDGARTETPFLYFHYSEWMCDNGYRAIGEAKFAQSIKRVFPKAFKDRNSAVIGGKTVWVNLRFAS